MNVPLYSALDTKPGCLKGNFGGCTNIGECEAVCPKKIKLDVIARMNGDFLRGAMRRNGASIGE